jgi:hypothetical protein
MISAMSDSNSDDDLAGISWIITPQEFLVFGLKFFFKEKKLDKTKQHATNIDRFVAYFGAKPSICATIWEDLQRTTTVQEA